MLHKRGLMWINVFNIHIGSSSMPEPIERSFNHIYYTLLNRRKVKLLDQSDRKRVAVQNIIRCFDGCNDIQNQRNNT